MHAHAYPMHLRPLDWHVATDYFYCRVFTNCLGLNNSLLLLLKILLWVLGQSGFVDNKLWWATPTSLCIQMSNRIAFIIMMHIHFYKPTQHYSGGVSVLWQYKMLSLSPQCSSQLLDINRSWFPPRCLPSAFSTLYWFFALSFPGSPLFL